MINLSNWRSVRLWESHVERQLRQRHWLWLHGLFIGSIVLGVMWLTSYLQMQMSVGSLALRYLVTLGVGYLAYLLVLRLWAGALVGRSGGNFDVGGDLSTSGSGRSPDADAGGFDLPGLQSGSGGDFGGGGASGDFSGAADAGGPLGELASGALDVAAGADEGAVVVVPVVAVFLLGCAIVFGAGSLAQDAAPPARYSIKQASPSTGSNIPRNDVTSGAIPLNRRYSELTREQQAI